MIYPVKGLLKSRASELLPDLDFAASTVSLVKHNGHLRKSEQKTVEGL